MSIRPVDNYGPAIIIYRVDWFNIEIVCMGIQTSDVTMGLSTIRKLRLQGEIWVKPRCVSVMCNSELELEHDIGLNKEQYYTEPSSEL